MSGRYDIVQARADHDISEFIIRSGPAIQTMNATIAADGDRALPLLNNTLLSKISDTQQFVPFGDVTATDGSALPAGIYMGSDIAAADLVAGDVTGRVVLLSDAWFDESKLVIEGGKNLDTIITIGTNDKRSVRDHLLALRLIPVKTTTSFRAEN